MFKITIGDLRRSAHSLCVSDRPSFRMNRMIRCLPLLLLFALSSQAAELERFERTERHMGSDFTVKLYAVDKATAEKGFQAAFKLIADYDKSMSDYNPDSELMRLCAKGPTEHFNGVSRPLFDVLTRARVISEKTDGAFDVTVGPLTKLWRRARRQKELPTDEERRSALEAVDWQSVETKTIEYFTPKRYGLRLKRPNMRLDLGGIAPGYAADQALAELGRLGITSALVDASGDVAVGDPPPGEKGWKIGIAPLKVDDPPDRLLLLANMAISTSGDAYRGVEIDGVRYSHIVDPKTGIGLKHRSSVTLLAPDCTTADALATAVSVLGAEKGLEVLKQFPNTHARIVTQNERGEMREVESEPFKDFVLEEE